MNRINLFRSMNHNHSLAWGRLGMNSTASAVVFAAVLIICSVTVGCSSEQPKPVSHNTQSPMIQAPATVPPAPVMQAASKPVPKKPVPKKPATVNYTDKSSGVTFEYPRRYAIETGSAATELVQSNPIPMNFIAPGGEALAAVELPETSFANTDFSSAFFNVSVHRNLAPERCNEFAVPAPKLVEAKLVEEKPAENQAVASTSDSKVEVRAAEAKPSDVKTTDTSTLAKSDTVAPESKPVTTQSEPQGSKLLLGDMELRATEAVTGEGSRQSDSKYFHVYQNGACYEFALNVTTIASSNGLIKHVDRDKVFDRLEKILATVKIAPVVPETTAEAPAPAPVAETPAQ